MLPRSSPLGLTKVEVPLGGRRIGKGPRDVRIVCGRTERFDGVFSKADKALRKIRSELPDRVIARKRIRVTRQRRKDPQIAHDSSNAEAVAVQ